MAALAPFFTGKKLASMNASSQSSTPLASNSERKALHISLRTSASYHSFRRRQQVGGILVRKFLPTVSRLKYPEYHFKDQTAPSALGDLLSVEEEAWE